MKTIPLSNNRGEAIVDDADFEELNRWRWHLRNGYATRKARGRKVGMHRQIMGEPSGGMQVDHINGNKLDNRRVNLRITDQSGNMHNRPKQSNNTSGLKGVTWSAWARRWRAQIQAQGRYYHLGYFSTREAAAEAFDRAAVTLVGECAQINGPRNPAPGSVNGR